MLFRSRGDFIPYSRCFFEIEKASFQKLFFSETLIFFHFCPLLQRTLAGSPEVLYSWVPLSLSARNLSQRIPRAQSQRGCSSGGMAEILHPVKLWNGTTQVPASLSRLRACDRGSGARPRHIHPARCRVTLLRGCSCRTQSGWASRSCNIRGKGVDPGLLQCHPCDLLHRTRLYVRSRGGGSRELTRCGFAVPRGRTARAAMGCTSREPSVREPGMGGR